jgi:hypothetical protein
MDDHIIPPHFFSWDFHLRFFPALLWHLLHPKNKRAESIFAGHISLELPVMVISSIILGIYGFLVAIGSGSIIGWICGILGLCGFIYLLTDSIRSGKDHKPSFEYFSVSIFLFLTVLGITTGLALGIIYHFSYGVKIITGLAGCITGYIIGTIGGIYVQYLGWMTSLLDFLALAAIAGMILVDIVMLM